MPAKATAVVIHFRGQALAVPSHMLPDLKQNLHLSYAYSEDMGNCGMYEHYDCWGVRHAS